MSGLILVAGLMAGIYGWARFSTWVELRDIYEAQAEIDRQMALIEDNLRLSSRPIYTSEMRCCAKVRN